MKHINKLISISIFTATVLNAATPPTSGDILRQTQQKPQFQEEEKVLPTVSKEYKAPLVMQDSTTALIKEFTFSGNTKLNSAELQTLVQPYMNQQLGINKLKEITSLITKYYRDHGYFVARAYLPEQKVKDGIIEIAIVEGTYGAFDIKNSSLVNDKTVQGFMDHLKNGQVVSVPSLERQMLLINDLSGVVVTGAEVYPGKEVGTSDFKVTTSPTNKYSGYGIIDNYGSRYTGEERVSVGATVNSLTHVGDTLSLTGMLSNTANLKNAGLSYERPLGYSGLKGGVSGSITDYTLKEIPNYDGYGEALSFNAFVSYPLIKTRSVTQNIGVYYAHKTMSDSSGNTGSVTEAKKSVDSVKLSFDDKRATNLFAHQGRLFSTLSVTGGHVNMDNDVAKTNDALINSQGTYSKANLNLYHTQQLSTKTTLNTTLNAQKSFGKNLDSSEDISVGGSNGVRAYEDAELSGDQGYALSLDLAYSLPKVKQADHKASLFIDHAEVWKNTTVFNTEKNVKSLDALGIGYTLNYKNFDLKASYAHAFGADSTPTSEAEFSTCKEKFLIQGMMRF